MKEFERFAVYSDFREGYLIGVGPSLWHYDIDCAIQFETEQLARAAAARRRSDLAVAGRIIKVDGGLDFEPLAKIDLAPPGTWIVTITDTAAPGRIYYLVKGGRVMKMSTSPGDAKGYRFEGDAKKIVDAVNAGPRFSAQARQQTAQVVKFPSEQS